MEPRTSRRTTLLSRPAAGIIVVILAALVLAADQLARIQHLRGVLAAGQGVAPLCLAALVDHAIYGLGLHRVEVNIRPENVASLRVVAKLGLRDEGLRLRYLHIDGDWRDHRSFAVTAEEVPDGLLARWLASRPRP